MRHFLLLSLVFAVHVCFAQVPKRKVLFIGIDGCRWDALQLANTPGIDALLNHAIYSGEGLCDYKTWSGNGWSSMLTGVWNTKHGVTDNTFNGSNYGAYPDFITRAEAHDPSLRTVSCVHWAPINNTIIQNADLKQNFATDLAVKNAAVNALTNDNPDILFVAFDDVDHAGHSHGFSPAVPQYIQSIEITDAYVASMLIALQNRPNIANEDWLIIVTTDHGGTPAGHGGGTLEERTIFNIFSNPAFSSQELERIAISQTAQFDEARFSAGAYARPLVQTPFSFGAQEDFTIEFWVKANAAFGSDPTFISNKNWNSGLNAGYVISAQAGQFWKVNIGDGVNRLDIQGGYIRPGDWHHLAVSFDRDGLMTAYEDGAVVGSANMISIGNINTAFPLVINQDGTTTYTHNFAGSYKDIRIWSAAIPQEALLQWANAPVTASHPYYNRLLANWKCDADTGAVLEDSSPNQNHCTVTGTLIWAADEEQTFTVYDYSATPREPDNAVTALQWLCIPIEAAWSLDGRSFVDPCIASSATTAALRSAALFTVQPNPAKGEVELRFSEDISGGIQLRLTDLQGKTILLQSLPAGTRTHVFHPGASLSKGVYLIKAETRQGYFTEKLILE